MNTAEGKGLVTRPDLLRGLVPDERLAQRYHAVCERLERAALAAGRDPQSIQLVAISKHQPPDMVRQLAALGHRVFGENYIQEARAKALALHDTGVEWHFTGRLQSNKAKGASGGFCLIHTVDSLRLGEMLQKNLERQPAGPDGLASRQSVLVQVNIGAEPQKAGVLPEDLPALAEALCALSRLDVQGLMCLPPVFDAGEAARPFFAALRVLRDKLAQRLGTTLPFLSMGMSGDAEWAILEGASHVRIGTDIFGPRPA